MNLDTLRYILAEKELSAKEKNKKEEIVMALKRDHPDWDKDKIYAIATAKAKEMYESELNEISQYDLVVTYYRSLGLDPYKLKGKVGEGLRDKIKNSPAFHAWLKSRNYESVEALEEGRFSNLTADDLLKHAKKSGFEVISQKGSHIKLKHPKSDHELNALSIPYHKGETVSIGVAADTHKRIDAVSDDLKSKKNIIEKVLAASKDVKSKKKPQVTFYSTGQQDIKGTEVNQPSIENDCR